MDERPRPSRRDTASVAWGLILVAVGLWFFLDQTLGLRLPAIPWGDLWPVLLILLGGWILLRASGRRG